MPYTAPNDTPVLVSVRLFDKWRRPMTIPDGSSIQWTPGDPSLASLVPSADNLSAKIVPLRGAKGDYAYSWLLSTTSGNTVQHDDVVTFEDPLPSEGQSDHSLATSENQT